MKRIFALISVIVITLAAVLPVDAKKLPDGIEMPTRVFDFGTVKSTDKPVETSFTLLNTGKTPLAILSSSSTCGCSKAEFPTKPIEPGKSAVIKVKFNPMGQSGEITREVKLRVKRAGGKSARITLTIRGTVVRIE